MKKLVRPVRKVNTAVLGLDVHQDLIVFTHMDRGGDEVEQGSLPGTAKALLALLERVEGTVHVALEAGGSPRKHGSRRKPAPHAWRARVEEAAVAATRAKYEDMDPPYTLKSVEKDNVGWDLTATRGDTELQLEVKGLSGPGRVVELTPNEYATLLRRRATYRVCIVPFALDPAARRVISCALGSSKEAMTGDDDVDWRVEPKIGARLRCTSPLLAIDDPDPA